MTSRPERAAPPELYFIASAISLYLGAAIAVDLFDDLPPGAVAWLRVTSAALILCLWRRPWRRTWTRPQLVGIALFGVATAGMNLTFYLAADRIDLGAGVAIESSGRSPWPPTAFARGATRAR